jgi:hypothetical protein
VLVGVATTFELTIAEHVDVATVEDASVAWIRAVYVPFVPYVTFIEVLVLPATLESPDHSNAYGELPPVGAVVHVTTLLDTLPAHVTARADVSACTAIMETAVITIAAAAPKMAIFVLFIFISFA